MQRAAGYRAAFEWLPRTVFPRDRFRVFKRIALGRTADLFLLDERQYRTVDAGDRPLQLLGDAQLGWLVDGLAGLDGRAGRSSPTRSRSPRWTTATASAPTRGAATTPRARSCSARSSVRGSATSCSSRATPTCSCSTRSRAIPRPSGATRRTRPRRSSTSAARSPRRAPLLAEPDVQARNPWNRQYNGAAHGYALVRLDGAAMTTEYRRSDLSRPDGLTLPFERFVQPTGANAVTRETLAV